MGGGRWTSSAWSSYSTSHVASKKNVDEIYESRKLNKDLDPKNVVTRESRDSADNPNSHAMIVGLDVTGSMDHLLDYMAREGLSSLMKEIYEKKPVTDPHVMFMAIGDVECDHAPLQVSQFEADIRIAEQLKNIYLERGGGGNHYESYILPWYFAAFHTSIDCFEKRGKKGYLFTVGDEEPTPRLNAGQIKLFIGDDIKEEKFTAETLLSLVSKQYNVFHLIVTEGSNYETEVKTKWKKLLGQRALPLTDHKKMAETIISAIQVCEGVDKDEVISSWKSATGKVVAAAIKNLTSDLPEGGLANL